MPPFPYYKMLHSHEPSRIRHEPRRPAAQIFVGLDRVRVRGGGLKVGCGGVEEGLDAFGMALGPHAPKSLET